LNHPRPRRAKPFSNGHSDGSGLVVAPNVRFTHGLFVRTAEDGNLGWWHTGATPGTATYYARHGRYDIVVLFNLQPEAGNFYDTLAREVWRALYQVTEWPAVDLFNQRP